VGSGLDPAASVIAPETGKPWTTDDQRWLKAFAQPMIQARAAARHLVSKCDLRISSAIIQCAQGDYGI
jgi:hypothetical protein